MFLKSFILLKFIWKQIQFRKCFVEFCLNICLFVLFRDLSETSISKLPTLGIDTLETLKLQNTFTLKEFPSVMNFKNMRTAFLTYPYHCCAFKFPATHNPKEFARHHHLFNEDVKKRFILLNVCHFYYSIWDFN